MVERLFVSPESLHLDSYELAARILESGFYPNYTVALWRGGTPVGVHVQELLSKMGVNTDHIAIRTKRYDNQQADKPEEEIIVDNLEYVIDRVTPQDCLLLVDDVFDSGLTMQEVIRTLHNRARRNTPSEIRIATVYYKPNRNITKLKPDYYIHETDKWIYFPHELADLTLDQIREGKGEDTAGIIERLQKKGFVMR